MSGSAENTKSSDAPNLTRPRSAPAWKYCRIRAFASNARFAKGSTASPSGVVVTLCVSRASSLRPVCASSRVMCWLTVDWLTPNCRAAVENPPVSTTATKLRNKTGSSKLSISILQSEKRRKIY